MNEILLNKYQTPIDDNFFKGIPDEVQDQFWEFYNNVPYIRNLTSVKREYAKDRPKDKDGKIIIDLSNPHILEDMDYFRPSAIHFERYGCYTFLRPNGNPNSEYGKWILEETNRCWNGFIRPSDGEWIPGLMYWFLNYSPIQLTKINKGSKKANRVDALPEVWEGIYFRFHYRDQARKGGLYNDWIGGQHCAELASRGKGKSYCLASILSHNFVLGEDSISSENTRSFVTAYQKEYLTKDGVITKFCSMIDHCADNTQWPRKRLKSSFQEMTWTMGYKDVDLGIDRGTGNTVIGVSAKDDEGKMRGKRACDILIEEFGTFSRLIDLYNVLLPSVQEGEYSFGQIYALGTAGDNESDFAGAQELMYNPYGYNMYALPNVYDKVNQGKPHFVYFFPGFVNRKGCYNEDGVSDVTKALLEILMQRHKVKHNSSDPNTILKTIAEIPITPAEAILKTGVNMFPVTYLSERLAQIDSDESILSNIYVGNLSLSKDGKVEYNMSSERPIRNFPHKDNKLEGAIELIQLPHKDKEGKVYNDRYIAGADTYDDDSSETMSLGSIFILDMWTDEIVAEYTGRPQFADDFYEICRRLCLFYNARLNYENNKKGLFAYFSSRNCLYLLTDVLEFLKDKDLAKGYTTGNKQKGTQASAPINNYAKNQTRAWLLKPITIQTTQDGEDCEISITNLYRIKNRALLQELISFNNEGNFDRISALGMLMLLREDKMILYQGDLTRSKNRIDKKYLGNDAFFSTFDKKAVNLGNF